MKRTQTSKPENDSDDLKPEYRWDYRKARPNRFSGLSKETRVVVLDPDVAQVFTTSDAVNKVLRALIENIPTVKRQTGVE